MQKSVLRQIFWDRKLWRLAILIFSLISTFLGLLAPYFQKEFIDHLTGRITAPEWSFLTQVTPTGFILIAFACILLNQAFNQLTNFIGARESLFTQRKLAQLIYEKTLSLKVDTLSQRPLGEIVSLYATDVPGSTIFLEQTIPQGATTFFPLILAPLALSYILKTSLTPTIIVMILTSSINTALAFRQSKFFFLFKQLAAERIGLVNEWITQIRGLRIMGWIQAFEDKIYKKRVVETANRINMVTNGQVMNSISSSMTFTMNVMALASITLLDHKTPTSGEIFASLWILGVFLTRPFRQMPWFFTFAFDAWTSTKRVQKFLKTENIISEKKNEIHTRLNKKSPEMALEVYGMHLQKSGELPQLNNIDFKIKEGEFVAFVGEVGCGKSLFLLSLLRETGAQFDEYLIHQTSVLQTTDQEVKSHFSYVPQESFIMSATLEQNICFDYQAPQNDPTFILKALEDSQFKLQKERLNQGLQTELGERGVNLSGGQRQRISLARVAANERQFILVDDGFSNLDVKTEEALLQTLFFGRWKNKTRILATHRLSVLPYTDRIIFMKAGQIISEGRFEDLLRKNSEFREFAKSLSVKESSEYAEK